MYFVLNWITVTLHGSKSRGMHVKKMGKKIMSLAHSLRMWTRRMLKPTRRTHVHAKKKSRWQSNLCEDKMKVAKKKMKWEYRKKMWFWPSRNTLQPFYSSFGILLHSNHSTSLVSVTSTDKDRNSMSPRYNNRLYKYRRHKMRSTRCAFCVCLWWDWSTNGIERPNGIHAIFYDT